MGAHIQTSHTLNAAILQTQQTQQTKHTHHTLFIARTYTTIWHIQPSRSFTEKTTGIYANTTTHTPNQIQKTIYSLITQPTSMMHRSYSIRLYCKLQKTPRTADDKDGYNWQINRPISSV
jgi:hypothetical protein